MSLIPVPLGSIHAAYVSHNPPRFISCQSLWEQTKVSGGDSADKSWCISTICPKGAKYSRSVSAVQRPDIMKETAAKRRDKAGGRDSKAEKTKEPGPQPQDVEMPEEEAANAAKQPKELDSLTLDGKMEWVKWVKGGWVTCLKLQEPVHGVQQRLLAC